MQYAIIDVQGRQLLVDANEIQALEVYRDTFRERPLPAEDRQIFVCYGSYMPQRGISQEDALEDLMQARGYWLGHVYRDQGCSIGFHDVVAYSSVSRGLATYIPFAAAIFADDDVIERVGSTSRQAVTAFLRFSDQMDALTNVLNRRGVIAFKGIERRHKEAVTVSNWQNWIDEARAKRTARNIF